MSTTSWFMERHGRRVQIRDIDLVHSGSSGWLALEAEPGFTDTIPVARLLRRRGVPITVGKPAVEALLFEGAAQVHAEHIDGELEGELRACKVRMSILPVEAAAE